MRALLLGFIAFGLFGLLTAFWFTPPVLGGSGNGGSTPPTPAVKPAPAAKFDFIGVKKCSMCHKTEAKGAQLQQWQASSHAKAYAVLSGDKAKAVAAARKLPKPPQESPECLKCHVTAFPVMANLATAKITLEEGVSCESCHGPGSEYSKMSNMKAITAGTQDPKALGLVMPTTAVCQKCHNEESPTFKGFKFEEMVAKITHPDTTLPRKK